MKIDVRGNETYCYTNNREIDAKLESIVFLHGAGMDHTVWTMYARHFARHDNNVIAVDLPSHGRSGGEPIPTIDAMADWIVELLDTRAPELRHAQALEQTALVLDDPATLLEATTHLTANFSYPLVVVLSLLLPLAVYARDGAGAATEFLNARMDAQNEDVLAAYLRYRFERT